MKLGLIGYLGLILFGVLLTVIGFPISFLELYIAFSQKSYWLSFLFI